MTVYTNLELSKKLKENGCFLESEYSWEIKYDSYQINDYDIDENDPYNYDKMATKSLKKTSEINTLHKERVNGDVVVDIRGVPAYDLIQDICIKNPIEFFGKSENLAKPNDYPVYYDFVKYTQKILFLLQEGKQKKAENYFWSVCKFNPNNKGEK